MALEKYIDSNRLNIKSLTLETPEKTEESEFFDPDRDITEYDWEKMKESLDTDRLKAFGQFSVFFVHQAFYMKYLNPEKMKELALNEQQTTNLFEKFNETGDAAGLALMKLLYPEKDVDLFLNEGMYQHGKQFSGRCRPGGGFQYILNLFRMKVLFPEKFSDLDISEGKWIYIKEELGKLRKDSLSNFIRAAGSARLISPERFSELEIDKEVIDEGKDLLLKFRKDGNEWPSFTEIAFYLKVLSAEKVKLHSKRLEMNMNERKKFSHDNYLLPQSRKF